MDVETLMERFIPIGPADGARKHAALGYAHHLEREITYDDFLSRVPATVREYCFGGQSDDAYFTSLFASIAQHEPNLDWLWGALVNKLAIQLTFQTRFFINGRGPDIFAFDGDPNYFNIAMANANVVIGFLLEAREIPQPTWEHVYPHIEIASANHLARVLPDVQDALTSLDRSAGVVAIMLPLDADFAFHERYAPLACAVDAHTSYALWGMPSQIRAIRSQIFNAYPQARVRTVFYNGPDRSACAILVAEGIATLPQFSVDVPKTLKVRFVPAAKCRPGTVEIVQYRNPDIVIPEVPSHVISTAPVSDAIITQMSARTTLTHRVAILKNGLLCPAIGPDHSTYLSISEDGDILTDYGNEETVWPATEVYKKGHDVDGVTYSELSVTPIELDGAAFPLTFAPTLHHFFSHFMMQCLPRVSVLRDLGIDATFIVPHDLRAKQKEMLILAGISPKRIFNLPKGACVRAESLIVPVPWGLAFGEYNTEVYTKFLHAVAPHPPAPTRRILISRGSRRTWRNMLTYDAVRYLLTEKHGFEEIRAEELTVAQEIRLFSETKILVGAEGAGMYSACYMQPNSSVITISDEDYFMPILGSLAKMRGFQYIAVLGESFRAETDVQRRLPHGHADYTVAPLAVEEAVLYALQTA